MQGGHRIYIGRGHTMGPIKNLISRIVAHRGIVFLLSSGTFFHYVLLEDLGMVAVGTSKAGRCCGSRLGFGM